MNKYDDHFMSGGFINLRYTTYHSQIMKIVGAPSFNVNLSRALTYLRRIYATFIKAATVGTGANPSDFWVKSYNTSYHSLRKYDELYHKLTQYLIIEKLTTGFNRVKFK